MTSSRIKRWIFSLPFGIGLLVLVALYVTFGTLLPQDLPPPFYLENYRLGGLILALGFHQTYSSWIFRLIMVFFVINLAGCTCKLIPSQQRRFQSDHFPSPRPDAENLWPPNASLPQVLAVIRSRGFNLSESGAGSGVYHAARHRMGIFGSTVTHIGIITIVLGSFVGNHFAQEGFLNLMPGETALFHKEGFAVSLKDFYITYRPDGTTEQYYSDLIILENELPVYEETIWVNRPLRYRGMMLYQTSFGWASRLEIRDLSTGEMVHQQFLRNDQSTFFQPAHLTIHLFGYYPDFQMRQDGMPMTITMEERNPHYAVILYHFGEFVDSFIMNPSQRFTYQGYEIGFPGSVLYTGLIYRKDYGYYAVLLGCLLLLSGLTLAFYFYPKYILIKDGELFAISRQNAWGFETRLKRLMSRPPKKVGDKS